MPDINMQIFEEVQRNQLVTEVDIQTQVALDDYQVQLSDIANPTQSQDNVVIDRFGEFLPHWNESLDFDTWVKISMEVAGKRILMLRGNSNVSSASNGGDTFLIFDDDWSLSYTTVAGTWSVASGIMSQTGTGQSASKGRVVLLSDISEYIVTSKIRVPSSFGVGGCIGVWLEGSGVGSYHAASVMHNDPLDSNNILNDGIAWGTSGSNDITLSTNTWFMMDGLRAVDSQKSRVYAVGTVPSGWQGYNTLTSDAVTNVGLMGGYDTVIDFDWWYVRKYVTTEPTWVTDGAEQNIAVALKSLGRAG